MKPITLMMKAFGPYPGETTIDFTKLGNQGIYLITGDTGAGKTTIFDAIVYALYDKASGNVRDNNMFRSDYADPKDETFVKLKFAYGGKEYTVTRSPSYERPKQKGEGTTLKSAEATLEYEDGRVITKTTDVTKAITEIIGLDYNQFVKIGMLAQGEFQKLLLDSTENRSKIFQKLFHTENFFSLQLALKEMNSDTKKEYEAAKNSASQYVEGILCKEGSAYEEKVEAAKAGTLSVDEILELLNDLLDENKNEAAKLEVEIEDVDKKRKEYDTLVQKAKDQEDLVERIERAKEQLTIKKDEAEELKKKQQQCEEKLPEAQEKRKKAAAINERLDDYDELEEAIKDLEGTKSQFEANSTALEKKSKQLETIAQNISNAKEILKKHENAGEMLIKANTEKENLTLRQEALEELNELHEKAEKDLEALNILREKYKEARKISLNKAHAYEEANMAYLDAQAGIIAEELVEGEPCRVCGSIHHPTPAIKPQNAPSEAELKELEESSKQARKDAEKASLTGCEEKAKFETLEENLKDKSDTLLGKSFDTSEEGFDEAMQRALTELNDLVKANDKEVLKANAAVEEKKKSEKSLPAWEEDCKALEEEVQLKKAEEIKLKSYMEAKEKAIATLREKLAFESKAAAIQMANNLTTQAQNIEKDREELLKKVEKNKTDITSYESTINANEETLKNQTPVDGKKALSMYNDAEDQHKELNERFIDVKNVVETNKRISKKLKDKIAEIQKIEEKLTQIEMLNNTANGGKGMVGITLETFVQMTYFDRIIARANERLKIMSGGQFELVRNKPKTKTGKVGLDLDVIDYHNGSQRSACSLSGGEKFKASLSLALGLSDEIQSSAGGIRLDTMFVDEGFGSLDSESIGQAMEALQTLTEGDKLVGIISHVEELKSKIDKQIVVKKETGGGSVVEITA